MKAQTMNLGHEGHWYDGLLTGVTGGAILAFAMGCLKLAEKALPFLIKRRVELDVVAGITDQSQAYMLMERAIKEDGARRVIMFTAHNCGHIPSKTKPFYVSAVHVVADTIEHRQRASAYKNLVVDSHYITMLERLFKDGIYHFRMGEESHDCVLHQFYSAEGVTDSIICYLGVWNNSMVYVSFTKFEGLFSTTELHNLKMRAVEIREELKR